MAKQFSIFATTCFLLVTFTSHCYAVTCVTLTGAQKPPTVVAKRAFDNSATLGNSPNTLERVYVNGRSIDEPLLAAIDGDGDEFLNTSKNTTNGVNLVDAEYYYLSNRLGSISAILDADNQDRILEYYRYEVFGSATVLPIVDVSPVDGLEDTPLDLNDNNASGATLVSSFGNTYLYTARRFDDITGLYYYRNRYYDPRSGRFITRDPQETPWSNLYSWCLGNPLVLGDPMGLKPAKKKPVIDGGADSGAWVNKGGTRYLKCGYYPDDKREIQEVGPVVIYDNAEVMMRSARHMKGATVAQGVGNVSDVLDALKNIAPDKSGQECDEPCKCINNLTIVSHGGMGFGGFRIGNDVVDVNPRKNVDGGNSRALYFGAKIRGYMCKDCIINLMACSSAKENAAALIAIARASGCKVRGSSYYVTHNFKKDGSGYNWWWIYGKLKEAQPDGSVKDITMGDLVSDKAVEAHEKEMEKPLGGGNWPKNKTGKVYRGKGVWK